jgi:hypothetical protein
VEVIEMSGNILEFSAADIVIAEDGRVTINNPEFTRHLIAHVKKVAPDHVGIFDNCDCKGNALNEISLAKILPSTTFRLDPGVVGIFDNCDCKGRVLEKGGAIR